MTEGGSGMTGVGVTVGVGGVDDGEWASGMTVGVRRGALKQPRGLFRELLRLTVSLWSLPCARLEPGGVFQEVRFSSVFPGPCDKRTVWRQLPRQYGRP